MTFNRKEFDELQILLNEVTNKELGFVLTGVTQSGVQKPGSGMAPGQGYWNGRKQPDEANKKRSATMINRTREYEPRATSTCQRKPCTIDGITIYPSRKALVKALGQGKKGAAHPDFRYV